MKSIYSLTQEDLKDWMIAQGEKNYRADQIWQWLYRQHVGSFEEMTNIPKKILQPLSENFVFSPLKTEIVQRAQDKTTKFLFELHDHAMIETVLMYHHYGVSVCVTTQIGCNIGCKFCASGLIPKVRDLETGEIVAQIMFIQRYLDQHEPGTKVSHIVVMGIGEPFDNYENVMNFLRIVNSDKGLAIGARHITVSTSGLAPKIRQFAREGIQVNLAVSLHAPNNETRSSIMKINREYPIEELFAAIYEYIEITNRRVTFEYIMIDGVNDTPQHAKELVALLKPMLKLSYVNLIPYNPVLENSFERSSAENIAKFFDILMKNKVNCVVRKEHGTDIEAACGQLRSQYERKKREKGRPRTKEEIRQASNLRRQRKQVQQS
ncbi:23S rRNA (adenine(2503)-C(2))-methyltransferase RlmN [Facklamia sp. DSM 111018]|uniref:Probable dual-specificity RNA methyltransferase RlmN n=1 Tax=Facklamia lactis TaxID=2749967 RepID=A0ABS0LR86_9LACT|nr:23S rRNA (adenine(2503)-C(2))-methyltransferase RlmN [Facklamia lactis]MBG9980961.1 23S rRNA (adenine(2503)-C(2))-methyltransferase RlmN [Facklamia lactis]MBG9986676.1 23S rRNA (adenine(2503)-C(2))-methyltransferase RlmN [Facklamia lactis]